MHSEAAIAKGARIERTTEHGYAFAHAGQAVTTITARRRRPAPVIDDLDDQTVRKIRQDRSRFGRARVLDDVGERLLHDPVSGEVDAG